jgi:hypothetical protein
VPGAGKAAACGVSQPSRCTVAASRALEQHAPCAVRAWRARLLVVPRRVGGKALDVAPVAAHAVPSIRHPERSTRGRGAVHGRAPTRLTALPLLRKVRAKWAPVAACAGAAACGGGDSAVGRAVHTWRTGDGGAIPRAEPAGRTDDLPRAQRPGYDVLDCVRVADVDGRRGAAALGTVKRAPCHERGSYRSCAD